MWQMTMEHIKLCAFHTVLKKKSQGRVSKQRHSVVSIDTEWNQSWQHVNIWTGF